MQTDNIAWSSRNSSLLGTLQSHLRRLASLLRQNIDGFQASRSVIRKVYSNFVTFALLIGSMGYNHVCLLLDAKFCMNIHGFVRTLMGLVKTYLPVIHLRHLSEVFQVPPTGGRSNLLGSCRSWLIPWGRVLVSNILSLNKDTP